MHHSQQGFLNEFPLLFKMCMHIYTEERCVLAPELLIVH